MFFDTYCKLCRIKGVSCKKAACEIGLSNSITTKWKKTDAIPSGETLTKIADYFNVTTDYLLGIDSAKEASALSFVDAFYELCEKHSISPNKACTDIGISRTSPAKWKSGSVPNGQTLSKIANYFGVTTDYLLGKNTTSSVERIKELCKEKKLAISRLEKDLGFANGYIGQLRKGMLPADRLQAIAEYLNVTAEHLLGVEAKKEPTFFAFYDKFISLCNLKGITRTKACTDCGLSRTAWRKWMDGGLPNGMAIGKFAEYFGVSVDELLGIATKNKPLTINGKILSDAEISLIELFRQVSGNRQQLILQMIRVAINNQE